MAEFADLPGPGPGTLADHLPRVDAASQRARLAYWERVLTELDAIPVAELSVEERVNASVFRTLIEEQANDVRFRTYEAPFNSDSFFWTGLAPRSGFADADEYRRFIGRLRDLPRYFDENIANMRAGLARGFSIPRVTLAGRERTMEPLPGRGRGQPPLRAVHADAGEHPRRRAGAAAQRRSGGDPRSGGPGLSAAPHAHVRRRISAARPHHAGGARSARRRSSITGRCFANIRRSTSARAKSTSSGLERGRPHPRRDGGGDAAGRVPGRPAAFIQFLRTDPRFYAQSPREMLAAASYFVMKAPRPAERDVRHAAALPPRHHPRPGRDRPGLYQRPRRARELPVQHLEPAGAAALPAAGAGAARMHARPQLPGGAGARRPGSARIPPGDLFLRLWRGLGPLCRMAGHRDGHLRDAL